MSTSFLLITSNNSFQSLLYVFILSALIFGHYSVFLQFVTMFKDVPANDKAFSGNLPTNMRLVDDINTNGDNNGKLRHFKLKIFLRNEQNK